jgi:hypothetical protein
MNNQPSVLFSSSFLRLYPGFSGVFTTFSSFTSPLTNTQWIKVGSGTNTFPRYIKLIQVTETFYKHPILHSSNCYYLLLLIHPLYLHQYLSPFYKTWYAYFPNINGHNKSTTPPLAHRLFVSSHTCHPLLIPPLLSQPVPIQLDSKLVITFPQYY